MEDRLDRLGGPPPTPVSGPRERPDLPRDPDLLPDLPVAYELALDRGLTALGLTLPPDARTAISAHVRLLLAWNPAINLTAITEPEAVATRHVIDSLTAVPLLAGAASVLDLGSGGGFPGIPLAMTAPAARVSLVDAIAKKVAFLEAVVSALGLGPRVEARVSRAEALAGRGSWDVVTARGVGAVADLVEVGLPLLTVGGRLVAWKRGDLTDELAAAARAAAALGGTAPVVHAIPAVAGLKGHLLVEIAKARPTPGGYPRDPGARRRRPW